MSRTKRQNLVREELVEIPKLEQEPEEGILVREEPQMNRV
jgi:hypothetical protein